MLERYFGLREHRTTVSMEIMAGVATFLTAVYILAVNPMIQAATGMPQDALFTATAVAIIIGTFLIGFFANMPFILAPGMGINMFFAYAIVGQKGYSWQEALTAVLLAGVLFVLTGALGLRRILLDGFPEALKHAMTMSLGLMIAVIGLKNAGIIEMKEGFAQLGTITTGGPLLALIGIVITGAFLSLGMRTAVLLGIIVTTVVGMFMGVTNYEPVLQGGAFSLPPSLSPIAMQFSFQWDRIFTFDFMVVIFTLLAIDIFDSLGTFVGVLNHFSTEEKLRYHKRVPRALMCDAVATVAGACVGASMVTTYVESSTGIQAGGRTGLVSMTICVLVLLSLFISPLFLMVPAAATTPALVVVGMYMMAMSTRLVWSDVSEALPTVVMILVTAFTSSISDGLMFGWIGYLIFKLIMRKWQDLTGTVVVVGIFFILRLIFL
ncbi:MAG: NCS2 family permease [Planctomycetes bacterium]|nr:NCS2 family permease [Planctomycetota bacterium]